MVNELQQIHEARAQIDAAVRSIATTAAMEAISKAGGPSALAKVLGVTRMRVANWAKRGVPEEFCLQVEAKTGVRAERLAPNSNWARKRTDAKTIAKAQGGVCA